MEEKTPNAAPMRCLGKTPWIITIAWGVIAAAPTP
jgi:hypothetical protein